MTELVSERSNIRSLDLFKDEILINYESYLSRIIGLCRFNKDFVKSCGRFIVISNYFGISYEIRKEVSRW